MPQIEEKTSVDSFADDVRTGLNTRPKYLLAKYFYDKAGSELFEELPLRDLRSGTGGQLDAEGRTLGATLPYPDQGGAAHGLVPVENRFGRNGEHRAG